MVVADEQTQILLRRANTQAHRRDTRPRRRGRDDRRPDVVRSRGQWQRHGPWNHNDHPDRQLRGYPAAVPLLLTRGASRRGALPQLVELRAVRLVLRAHGLAEYV